MNILLASDHSELAELLDELFAAFEASDVGETYQRLDLFWARLAMHIRAEHLHLFPAIISATGKLEGGIRPVPSLEIVKGKIAGLQEDHNFFMRKLLSAIKQLHVLRENNQADLLPRLLGVRELINAVGSRLETHNEMEESEVYGWAEALLEASAREELNVKMQKELANLPPRFKKSVKRS